MGETKIELKTYTLPNDINLNDVCFDDNWLGRAQKNAYDEMLYRTRYNDCYSAKKAREIERVIFSDKMTIVIWGDKTKTMVKCDDAEFDHEKGLAMAIAKKFLGTNKSKSNYYDVFKKWVPKNEEITISFDLDTKSLNFGKSLMHAFGTWNRPTEIKAKGRITKTPEEV